ncbi:MAG: hypothetical protein ACRCR9_05145 [Chitinophagaceae bacterium]
MSKCCSKSATHDDGLRNWITYSHFLAYLSGILLVFFLIGMSYGLYRFSYRGKPNLQIPESTLYTPIYK